MKNNIIKKLAALLTVSGLSLTAPLTVTAAITENTGTNISVSAGDSVTRSDVTYDNAGNAGVIPINVSATGAFTGTRVNISGTAAGGNGRYGVSLNSSGTVSLTDSGIIATLYGISVTNTSAVILNNTNITAGTASTNGARGVTISNSATLMMTGGTVTANNTGGYAIYATSGAQIILSNVTLDASGGSARTLYARDANTTVSGMNVSIFSQNNSHTVGLDYGGVSMSFHDSQIVNLSTGSVAPPSGTANTGYGAVYCWSNNSTPMTFEFIGGSITAETSFVTAGNGTSELDVYLRDTVLNSNQLVEALTTRRASFVLDNVDASNAGGIVVFGHNVGDTDVTVNGGSGIVGEVTNRTGEDGVRFGTLTLTLNDSSLTGTTTNQRLGVINLNGNNSVITGDVIGSGSSTTTVNLNHTPLTGKSSVDNDAVLTVNLDSDATWNLTGSSSLTTLNNSGTIIIANALGDDLTVSGAFVQDASATLDVTISGSGPIVNAGTASIGGTLKVSGFSGTVAAKASEIIAKNFTVIHTTGGINGDFSTVDLGGAASTVDYITLAVGKSNNDLDYTLNYGLSWFAASSTSHGNFTISSGTSFEINITLSDTAAGQGAGGWDGKTLTKLGDGLLLVSSSNNFTGGATVESGTLRLSNLDGLGTGTVNVAQAILPVSVLDLAGTGEYKNDTTGAGTIILSGNGVNISGTMTSQQNLGVSGSTAVNITQNGSLSLILGNGDYHFDQPLTGSGYLLLQNTGNISLVPSVPLVTYVPSFTGTVELQHNTLALTAANALPLSLATLVTGTNNLVVVDSDPLATSRNIGGLSFSGGTIRFEGYDPHATRADTIITVTDRVLNVSGGGAVEVVVPNPSQIPDGSKFTHIPLLQQDEGLALTQLVSATNGVTGDPSVTLQLRDDNGRIISAAYTLNLSHDGVTTDAIGTYDYGLSSGTANDGLYIAFQLKQVDIQAGRTLTLDQDTPTPAEGDDFSAKIIGVGNLNISANTSITLNGTGNSYTGTTTVTSGTLIVGADYNMFASSTAFVINSGAALNTGGFDQRMNNLTGSGLATFTNNTLTVNNTTNTSFTGTLSGGALVKDGGAQLNANDAVANLSQVQVENGEIILGSNATVSASGQPAVLSNGGTATFNSSALSTSGSVLILAKDNSPATVNLNNLTVSVSGNFVEANNGALTVTLNDSTATGKTAVANGGALNLGLNNSVWNMTGKSKLTTLTSSGGTITIDNVQGEDLVVTSGISGQTALNLTLSDSVKGNQEIWVVVDETNNMTGERFTLSHEVSYGMYNYNLVNANDGAWLVYTGSSGTIPPVNPPPVNPPTISNEGDTIINTAAAVAGFWFTQLDNLHKRMGELRYNKPAGGDLISNVWVRAYGQQINANVGIYSVKGFTETQYGVDLGTDYLWKLDADNQLYTGVFAGYGGADRDFHTSYKGSTDSGYGGVYATWLNNSGWYADVVAKGQYFRNSFDGEDHAEYDSLGAGISLEVGNMFEFKDGWFVEPSAQFSYLHLMNDNYTTRDNLHVDLTDADVLHIYGGARFGRNIKLTNSGMLQPYIKAGGLGQISSGNKLTVSGDHWRPNLDGARAVVGAGIVWQLNADSQLHLDYEASFGEKYDKPWGVNFGYRYQF